MRRGFLLLLILLMLPVRATCETGAEWLSQLDILSQRDPRLEDEKYYYQDMYFRIGGCKPASVTNALVALLGSPDTDVPRLLLELRRGLTYDASDKKASIELWRLPDYLRKPQESAVQLRQMLQPVTSIEYLDATKQSVAPAALMAKYVPNGDAHPLIIRELTIAKNWGWLLEMAAILCEQGHPDARFVLCAASVGNDETDAPLRSGTGGHFVSLYFVAEEFHRNGTLYLLDSLPRALKGDVYGFLEHYPSRYAFVHETKKPFAQQYDTTRIIDTVLQFELNDTERDKLAAISPTDSAARTALRIQQCESIILYAKSHFILYIP